LDNAREEMIPPKKAIGTSEEQGKYTWVTEHIEEQFQKNFVSRKSLQVMNQQMGSSAKLFSKLIMQRNQKSGESGYLY
jgi:hypothetical protein